jgi:sialate O-acetylesterase
VLSLIRLLCVHREGMQLFSSGTVQTLPMTEFPPFAFFRLFVIFAAISAGVAEADVRMPAIFGDHMVLEQDVKIPVWGWADAGEAVTVTLGATSANTTADAAGKWRVDLAPLKTASVPATLTVTGKNTLTFDDVLVGDVWVCSGQSNMAFTLGGEYDGPKQIAAANEPQLRLFVVSGKVALTPETDVKGRWMVFSPATAGSFSAVGYFFGRELSHALNRPIGLIGSYWGGMPAQAFTSLSALQKDPPFSHYVEQFQKDLEQYPKAKEAYPAALAAYQDAQKKWDATVAPTYLPLLKQWQLAVRFQ